MFKALLAMIVIFFVATFPATWLLMLFLGNVHVNVSYWGALPLGVVVSVLIGAAASQSEYWYATTQHGNLRVLVGSRNTQQRCSADQNGGAG